MVAGLGDKIKRLRSAKALTQIQLGDLIGVSGQTIGLYELSGREPTIETAVRLENALGVTTDFLLGVRDGKLIFDISELTDKQANQIIALIDEFKTLNKIKIN